MGCQVERVRLAGTQLQPTLEKEELSALYYFRGTSATPPPSWTPRPFQNTFPGNLRIHSWTQSSSFRLSSLLKCKQGDPVFKNLPCNVNCQLSCTIPACHLLDNCQLCCVISACFTQGGGWSHHGSLSPHVAGPAAYKQRKTPERAAL